MNFRWFPPVTWLDDFNMRKHNKLVANEIWNSWSKTFYFIGWWTTFLLKLVLMPLILFFWLISVIGMAAEWIMERIASFMFMPRRRALMKHVINVDR